MFLATLTLTILLPHCIIIFLLTIIWMFLMKKVVLLLAALAAAPAFAQNVYVTGSVGYAEQKVEIDAGSAKENDTGYSAAVGYRFTPNFGVEGGYVSFGKVSDSEGAVSASLKPESYYAAVVGTYPVSAQVSLSAKVGVARSSTKLSVTDGVTSVSAKPKNTTAMFGIGAAYAVTPSLAIVAEYQYFGKVMDEDGFNVKASLLSVGARYSF
jgi:OOP family OmpA-OmpF porin